MTENKLTYIAKTFVDKARNAVAQDATTETHLEGIACLGSCEIDEPVTEKEWLAICTKVENALVDPNEEYGYEVCYGWTPADEEDPANGFIIVDYTRIS